MTLGVCCMSLLMNSLDLTIVNVALPSIREDLGASVSGLQWTVDAYILVIAMLLMLSGSLGDRFGRRRFFRVGLSLFTLASLLCGLAPSLGFLVAFRMLQAVGGSMLNPVALGIIVDTFRDPAERARAIGVWGAVVGVSMALGPVIGGALVVASGWRSIFFVNLPIGLTALALTRLYVPESRAERARKFDPVGQVLIVVILGALVYAIIEAPGRGWSSPVTVSLFAIAAVSFIAFLVTESRRRNPVVDLRFFRSVPFSSATAMAVVAFMCVGMFLFVNTLYLQNVRGDSAFVAGLLTLPMAVAAAISAVFSGRLVAVRGNRLPLVAAGAATAIGGLILLRITPQTSLAELLVAYAGVGAGFGLVNAPITNTATAGLPRAQASFAAALASTSRQIGMSLGVAISGSMLAAASGPALTASSHAVWALMTVGGVAIAVVGLVATNRWANGTAQRTRRLLECPAERGMVLS
jgi:EmrB/QacA subfamily drug resistance transporter